MARKARYYLARVNKLGLLNNKLLIEAVTNPVIAKSYGKHFTFTEIYHAPESKFVFAHLSKFEPEGEVPVVRVEEHAEGVDSMPGLLVATSPFVYIPEFSGLAYQQVWNKLERQTFHRVFGQLVEEKHDRFMVECVVEALSDLRTFVMRLAAMEVIKKMRASVHPPNPRFSPLWKSLSDYLADRRAGELQVEEESGTEAGLRTPLIEIAEEALALPDDAHKAVEEAADPQRSSVTDAAVLMAADGYGHASIEGIEEGRKAIVRTKETQISFDFDREPEPEDLYEQARTRLSALSESRGLRH